MQGEKRGEGEGEGVYDVLEKRGKGCWGWWSEGKVLSIYFFSSFLVYFSSIYLFILIGINLFLLVLFFVSHLI